jgi:hypothetical protein
MWIKRTEDEVAKSIANAKSDAFVNGLLIGVAVWGLMTVMIAGGWLVNFSLGIVIQSGGNGDFWQRIPRSSLMTLPLAAFAFWYERRKALRKELDRTICVQCDAVGEANFGKQCACGGKFVSRSSVKWIEGPKE